jgi:hypothetical protein
MPVQQSFSKGGPYMTFAIKLVSVGGSTLPQTKGTKSKSKS